MRFCCAVAWLCFVRAFRSCGGRWLLIASLFSGLFASPSQGASPAAPRAGEIQLRLRDYLQLVIQHNEVLQAQMLDVESYRHKARAEYGVFEPELSLSAQRERNLRQNNSEQQSQLDRLPVFDEQNRTYDGAIESLMPTGAKIRIGSTLGDLKNNLPFFTGTNLFATNNLFPHQYQSFVGISGSQPLLKNAGTSVTLANIRLAALDSEIAFQQYRRQFMLIISQAEASYWNLYFAQEQLRFFDDSVSVAESILSDSQERLKAGRSSELDVLESQSGLALRRTKHNTAMQNYYDALGRLQTLAGSIPDLTNKVVRAVESPEGVNPSFSYGQSFQTAFILNPDYLIQSEKVNQEKVRLGFAKNQLLPELNLKGSYGFNGLGLTLDDSYANLDSRDFPSWTVGMELRIPLAGNIRGRHNFSAAKLTLQEALLNLENVQTQIANALYTAVQKARGWHESIQSYETVVRFNENVLKTQIERLNVGKIEARKVLEVESDLFDARQSFADALVQYRRSLLELELADGTILKSRHLDVQKEELRRKTLALLSSRKAPNTQFLPLMPAQTEPSRQ